MIGMRVREDYGFDIRRPDTRHLEASDDCPTRLGGGSAACIHQHHVTAGLDQQASIRAEYPVVRQMAGFERSAEFFLVGVGKEPPGWVGKAVAEMEPTWKR
jgi:hypothetical protein